jgi:cell division protease FtsH
VGHERSHGPLTFGKKEEQIFLGREIAKHQDYSEDTAIRIDQEVKKLVMDNYARAQEVLTAHKTRLMQIADELLVREVLDADQVTRLVNGVALDPIVPPSTAAPSRDTGKERGNSSLVPPINPKPLHENG